LIKPYRCRILGLAGRRVVTDASGYLPQEMKKR